MPEIAFLMGKSSSGKDHIFKAVVEDESLCLNTITMYTTRPMRTGEADRECCMRMKKEYGNTIKRFK